MLARNLYSLFNGVAYTATQAATRVMHMPKVRGMSDDDFSGDDFFGSDDGTYNNDDYDNGATLSTTQLVVLLVCIGAGLTAGALMWCCFKCRERIEDQEDNQYNAMSP